MPSLPAIIGALGKSESVLHAVYTDLAAPGVRQVGLALETVLKTGNLVLLPLRMLNEYAAAFERKNFKEIAERFSQIPEQDIIDIRPEIGAPILDKLSVTLDPDLRRLFIELLANSADKNKVRMAHPSYVKVIECLSPDEAHILKSWKNSGGVPCISVRRVAENRSYQTLRELVAVAPEQVTAADMLPMYIANMAGLGLLCHNKDAWLTEEEEYYPAIAKAKLEFPNIKDGSIAYSISTNDPPLLEGDVVFDKGYIEILAYGRVFQRACMPD